MYLNVSYQIYFKVNIPTHFIPFFTVNPTVSLFENWCDNWNEAAMCIKEAQLNLGFPQGGTYY